jgi:hypothetical protein
MDLTGFTAEEIENLMIQFHMDDAIQEGTIPEDIKASVWRSWAGEYLEQLKLLYDQGYCFEGLTKSYAVNAFLKTKYTGVEYPRHCSIIFHRDQIITKGDRYSLMEGLERVASGEIAPERLMFVLKGELDFRPTYYQSLPFGGARMPLDFPATLARNIMDRYAKGGSVLDPCHGWGGRLVGFLLSGAVHYVGYDVSPIINKGTCAVYEALKPYVDEKGVELYCGSVEMTDYGETQFDLVFTSPPYYDCEKYIGGEQSHQYKSYDEWKQRFLGELLSKSFKALKDGGILCLQIGSQKYPLTADATRIMQGLGYKDIAVLGTAIDNTFANTPEGKSEVIIQANKR